MATYRDTDTSPKEQFVYHAAGLAGLGGSSYIDSVIFRDRDNTNGFDGAADGTLEMRRFFAQNWRADVSAVLTDTGAMVERVKYSAYGTPFGLPAGDMNADGLIGTVGYDDEKEAAKLVGVPALYDVRADIDLDGDIDTADITAINASVGTELGRGAGMLTLFRVALGGYVAVRLGVCFSSPLLLSDLLRPDQAQVERARSRLHWKSR